MTGSSLLLAVGRRAATRAGRELAAEHLGTRRQRRRAREQFESTLGDSPINTAGPAESAILGLL